MKVPKTIEKELLKRGWCMLDGEKWRHARGQDWACAYFLYGIKRKVCLITVAQVTLRYEIQILYAHPVCSTYSYNPKSGFHVQSL